MEIPIISRMTELEASLNSLSNPSFVSRQAHRFWKYGALLLALVYAFTSVAYRIKLLFLQHRAAKSSISHTLFDDFSDSDSGEADNEEDTDSEEEEDFNSSSSEEEIDFRVPSYEYLTKFEDDFRSEKRRQSRKVNLRRRRGSVGGSGGGFSLSELLSNNSVVKLFDDYSSSDGEGVSLFDFSTSKVSSILGKSAAVTTSSPAVIVSAGRSESGEKSFGVNVWDARMRRRIPAAYAEWWTGTGAGSVVSVNAGGVDKIYVTDEASEDLIGDMRKVNSPLDAVLTEYDDDERLDANAVSVIRARYSDQMKRRR